jgi:hypothetical protein
MVLTAQKLLNLLNIINELREYLWKYLFQQTQGFL